MQSLPSLILFLALSARVFAYPTFEVSTFDTGRDGWEPNWPVGGIAAGDGYLSVDADGIGEKGKMVTFSADPGWLGDYFAAQVTGIEMDIANRSTSDDVHLRIALGNRASPQQTGGTWFLSSTAIVIPVGTDWTSVYLPLAEADLMRVANLTGELGTDSYEAAFSDIRNIRILSAILPLGAIGDEFVGDVQLDNIRLIPEPSSLLLLAAGIAVLALRRRHPITG